MSRPPSLPLLLSMGGCSRLRQEDFEQALDRLRFCAAAAGLTGDGEAFRERVFRWVARPGGRWLENPARLARVAELVGLSARQAWGFHQRKHWPGGIGAAPWEIAYMAYDRAVGAKSVEDLNGFLEDCGDFALAGHPESPRRAAVVYRIQASLSVAMVLNWLEAESREARVLDCTE